MSKKEQWTSLAAGLTFGCLLGSAVWAGAVLAQQQYNAPDEALWNDMARAIDAVPASGSAHQQLASILRQVQELAAKKAADKAAAEKPKE